MDREEKGENPLGVIARGELRKNYVCVFFAHIYKTILYLKRGRLDVAMAPLWARDKPESYAQIFSCTVVPFLCIAMDKKLLSKHTVPHFTMVFGWALIQAFQERLTAYLSQVALGDENTGDMLRG